MRVVLIAGLLLAGCANYKPGMGEGFNPYSAPPPSVVAPTPVRSGGMN